MQEKAWHTEVMTLETEQLLKTLGGKDYMRSFYLAGGTALALHAGHRKSIDLDFFSSQMFNEDLLVSKLQGLSDFSVVAKAPQTLHCHVQGVKVSFIGYPYRVLASFGELAGVSVADPLDIACMKISAIASRGTRRDFVDLYILAKSEGLESLLQAFEKKFAEAHYNLVHVMKSLVYFADAERDPMPDMLLPLSWDQVRQFFITVIPKLEL